MGLTAIVSGSSAEISMLVPIGFGAGSLLVSVTLLVLLGYLDIFDASNLTDAQLRGTLVGAIVPLVVVFAAIVLFQALQVLQGP